MDSNSQHLENESLNEREVPKSKNDQSTIMTHSVIKDTSMTFYNDKRNNQVGYQMNKDLDTNNNNNDYFVADPQRQVY